MITKRITALALCALICFGAITVFSSCSKEDEINETIRVTDMVGTEVDVKKNPQKVACVSRTTYDLLIAFGLGDYIDGVYYSLLDNEWAKVFDKDADTRYSCEYEESYETFLTHGVDLVFAPETYIADGLREHGITAMTVCLYGNPDFSSYVFYFADLVKQLWPDVEGVAEKVNAWKSAFTDVQNEITAELAKHNDEQRTLYYVRGDKNKGVGYTDNGKSFIEWAYRFLGFDYVGNRFESNKPSAEEICAINPDVVVIGGIYQKTLENTIRTTEPYTNLDAVKENRIFNIPVGLTMFEQLSVFSPAFLCDQANKLYPEYFHFDVAKQIKDLSLQFFGVTLTDEEISNMLNGLSRAGEPLA